MKKLVLSLAIMFLSYTISQAQNNLVVFSQGEQFHLIVNGIIQNEMPETNVKVVQIMQPNIKVKILFKDKSIPALDKNIAFMENGVEYVCDVVNGKNGRKLRLMSQAPIPVNAPMVASQTIVPYTTTAPVSTTTTTTTITNTNTANNNIAVDMNVNLPGMNVNISGGGYPTGTVSTTTTTSSTTIETTGGAPAPAVYQEAQPSSYSPCQQSMHWQDFEDAKKSIASKSFEDTKLSQAELILNSNCLTSAQVKEILKVFTYEETRLTFAKKAYTHTVDPSNFYKVNDAFTYSTSVDELNNYISKR